MSKKSPNPTDKHVGARVRMRRIMLGLSQSKLAEPMGLTFQQIQKYERGDNRIGASRLQQIATTLQVPVAFFFDGQPARDMPASGAPDLTAEFLTDRHGLAIVKAWPQVPPHLRAALVAMVEAAANPGKIVNRKAA